MAISPLPPAPSRADPNNFSARADALMAALPGFVNEINALQIETNDQTAADAAQAISARDEAVVARNSAIAAWVAAMAPAETLPALAKSLHSGAVVKSIIYDTSKDSDGGAWRKRTKHTSWYNETMGFTGAWRGQAATTAAAWALFGAAAGDGFQNTTDGKFYVLTGTNTATEIFRGNVREFPEQVAVVAESARVVIYDLTQSGCPMWIVFKEGSGTEYLRNNFVITGVAASHAKLLITSTAAATGLLVTDFISDDARIFRQTSDGSMYTNSPLVYRNVNAVWKTSPTIPAIVSSTVNDAAITVLDTAPIDSATGLPTPTIAVATAGGVSVITDSGTVYNNSAVNNAKHVAFKGSMLFCDQTSSGSYTQIKDVSGLSGTWTFTVVSVPRTFIPSSTLAGLGMVAAGGNISANGSNAGHALLKLNPSTPANSMVAYISNAYNSGWQVGDSRGAWLADNVAETVTESGELVTNGTFTTDTSGWAATGGATGAAVVSGEMEVTSSASGGYIQTVATVVGKLYKLAGTVRRGSATNAQLVIFTGTGTGGATIGGTGIIVATTTTPISLDFVATATTTTLYQRNEGAGTNYFDSISVKLASPDRSVKNNGLILVGSLTKTAVAAGAQLVSYSGFSATNYLEQPYNANLDFGTGDFCVMGWVYAATAIGSYQVYASRGANGVNANRFSIYHDPSDFLGFAQKGASTITSTLSTAKIPDQSLVFISVVRTATQVRLGINGVEEAFTVTPQDVTNSQATLKFGLDYDLSISANQSNLSLWRASATAPTADQIAQIYRDELPLFQPGAKCTIDGTSTAVTAMAYDDVTDLLHVGTSWGRSSFKGLTRIESEAMVVGAVTSLSGNQGAILTGGAASGYFYQPAFLLRDELRRRDEARRALGKVPVFVDFDAVTSQTTFTAPKGYLIKAVYSAGSLKRLGSTKDYTISDDGYQQSAVFGTAPGNTVWVSLMCVRA